MSGHAYRRHSTRLILAAALACALAWLGLARATEFGSISRASHTGAEVVVTQASAQHVTQRAGARGPGHVRAAVVSASQRDLIGTAALRALAIVLAMLLGLALARRDPLPRPAFLMHGVRAPPAVAPDRTAA